MSLVVIKDEVFKEQANILRDKFHQWEDIVIGYEDQIIDVVKVSKTSNATSLTTYSGSYGDSKSFTDVGYN